KLIDLDARQQTSVRWSNTRSAMGLPFPIDAQAFETIAEALKHAQSFDLVVVDTPGHLSPETFEIARSSDVIILPTGTSSDDLYPMTLLLYELEQTGIPKERLSVALCRMLELKEERWARRYLESTGHRALEGSLPERIGY